MIIMLLKYLFYNIWDLYSDTICNNHTKQLEAWWCRAYVFIKIFPSHNTVLVLTCCLMSDHWKGKPKSRMNCCDGMHYAIDLTVVSSSFHTPVFNVSKSSVPISVQSLASISLSFPTLEKTSFSNSCSIYSLPPSLCSSSLAQSDKHVIVPSTALARWILPHLTLFVVIVITLQMSLSLKALKHFIWSLIPSIQTSPTSHGVPDVRKLQEFELPYVSITSLHSPDYRIVLRKRYKTHFGRDFWALCPIAEYV